MKVHIASKVLIVLKLLGLAYILSILMTLNTGALQVGTSNGMMHCDICGALIPDGKGFISMQNERAVVIACPKHADEKLALKLSESSSP
jgi:hypothetical protein